MKDYDKNTDTVDYSPDPEDFPTQTDRFCYSCGYDENCTGEAIDCEVIEEAK